MALCQIISKKNPVWGLLCLTSQASFSAIVDVWSNLACSELWRVYVSSIQCDFKYVGLKLLLFLSAFSGFKDSKPSDHSFLFIRCQINLVKHFHQFSTVIEGPKKHVFIRKIGQAIGINRGKDLITLMF